MGVWGCGWACRRGRIVGSDGCHHGRSSCLHSRRDTGAFRAISGHARPRDATMFQECCRAAAYTSTHPFASNTWCPGLPVPCCPYQGKAYEAAALHCGCARQTFAVNLTPSYTPCMYKSAWIYSRTQKAPPEMPDPLLEFNQVFHSPHMFAARWYNCAGPPSTALAPIHCDTAALLLPTVLSHQPSMPKVSN